MGNPQEQQFGTHQYQNSYEYANFHNTSPEINAENNTSGRWNVPASNNNRSPWAVNNGSQQENQQPTTPGKNEPPDWNKSNTKKGKQKKGQKINAASLLHISSQPAADRVKIGEIEKA